MNYWPQKTQYGGNPGVMTSKTYDAWNMSTKKQTYAIQTKIQSKTSIPASSYGSYYRDVTNPRTKNTIREHKIAWSRSESIDFQVAGYNRLQPKTLAQKGGLESKRGFHSSTSRSPSRIPRSGNIKRGGLLGKTLGTVAMVGVSMLRRAAMGINKGTRMMEDGLKSRAVLAAARLTQQRGSNMYKPPIGFNGNSKHGRG